ncbi:MAG TPA: CDP-glycerol glycerophosphotransferase family protein [Halococcus sp.]|nr:CDP-glycerol glycerophosphotransferase family protein [Halococcus sp.]
MNAKRAFSLSLTGIQYLLGCVLFVVSLVWPREDTLWVFGAQRGEGFGDNSKYLFLYTVAERPHIRAVWLSRNQQVIEELQARGYEAYHADSARGILTNLRAGVAFVSHGIGDVNKWCCGGATTVSLWHGVGLKTVGWDYGLKTHRPLLWLRRELVWRLFTHPDWVVVTSDAMVAPFSSAFRMDHDRILVTGYPRNDALTGTVESNFETADIYDMCRRLYENSTVFIYTPTYREETDQYVRDHLDLAALDQRLADLDAYLILKLHPWEEMDIATEFSRIIVMAPQLDVYPLLKHTDVLITDYSSIYFDYLLLDRPVVFYPFDLEEYRAARGFYLDYEAVTPGPMATDFDGLMECIEQVLGNDTFADERRTVREQFLQQPENTRCGRICDRFDPTVSVD